MAKLIKCPRCETPIDVTDMTAGSTIRCPDCGGLARIPTGGTSVRPVAPAKPSRQTTLKKATRVESRPTNKKSNAPLVIGIVAGALAVIGGLAFALMGKKEPPVAKSPTKKPTPVAKAAKSTPSPVGAVAAPAGVFQPGARALALQGTGGATPITVNTDKKQAYEGLASAGKAQDIVREDHVWILYAIDGLLSDSETIARTSMEALQLICKKRKIDNQLDMKILFSAQARATEYEFWAFQWWLMRSNQAAVAEWANTAGVPVDSPGDSSPLPSPVARTEWDRTMEDLRVGGGFFDESTIQGATFARIKRMGKAAYPHLIRYIGHEDLQLSRAAVVVLNELTQRDSPRPTGATKDKIKEEWEAWYKAAP
jgi:hypothetical protein